MAAGCVAGIAHPRHAYFQQLWVAAAVRFMTVGTVLHDWWVFPKERPAPFCVTAIAVLIDRSLNQLARVGTAMWIVTTGAGHLAFAIGHVRRALQLCPPHLMASQTKFRLGFFCPYMLRKRRAVACFIREQGIAFGCAAIVNVMAIDACHGARLMWTATPEHLFAFVVTRKTSRVLFFYWCLGV